MSITDIETRDLTEEDRFGFMAGLKQILGAAKNGLNLYPILRGIPGQIDDKHASAAAGTPDNICWVDEQTGDSGILEHATGTLRTSRANPGGMMAFDGAGHVWYTFGGRANSLPFRLFRSREPYDFRNFQLVLDGYETYDESTGFAVHVHQSKVMLVWRRGRSRTPYTTLRFAAYDTNHEFAACEGYRDILVGGVGECHFPARRTIGIEQIWTRYDPKHQCLAATAQWYDSTFVDAEHISGSNPVVYSDDAGRTWRSVTGRACRELPLGYQDRDNLLVPHDH